MDFGFSQEQKMLRDTVRDFVRRECPREYVRSIDESDEFPSDEIFHKMGRLGWFGLPFAEKYGGTAGDPIDILIVVEELAHGSMVVASGYGRVLLVCGLGIYRAGTEEQKQYYIPRLARGELKLAVALTEAESGSDAAALKTTAIPDGDDYVINGTKMFVTQARQADYVLVSTRTDRDAPKHKGITTFIVDPHGPGVTLRKIEKLGLHGLPTYEMHLENVRVPKFNMLGGLNEGWQNTLKSLDMERMYIGALCTGAAQAALDLALEYAKQRQQFGRPIGKFQTMQHKFADLQLAIDSARLLAHRVAWMLKESLPCSKESSMAKLAASETFMKVALEGVQILGGYGYSKEYDMERYFRDAKIYTIGGGTSEIQRNVIAREMGL